MNRTLVDVVGTAAGVCSMISFAPQIAKILREREAHAVSLRMYLITAAAFALWVAYGTLQGSWPIWASNLVNLAMACAIVTLKLRFSRRGRRD
jgi:MtN3 and saliva related transmembrane protein